MRFCGGCAAAEALELRSGLVVKPSAAPPLKR
jgi:hypothetical protein